MDLSSVAQRLVDQKAELLALKSQRMIQRESLARFSATRDSSLIKVITGPRRAGKSVFCTQYLADSPYAYANFDDELLAGMRAEDLNLLVEAWNRIDGEVGTVFLDEVQNVEGWEYFVNRLQRAGTNIVLTGSNSRLLATELASHLTGRHLAIELLPFSFREFLQYREFPVPQAIPTTSETGRVRALLAEYLEIGGFAESYREPQPRKYLRDLHQAIISRDIAFRHRIRHISALRQIAQYLFAHLGMRVTFHKLKNIFSLRSVHTVQNYLSYMEESYLLFILERYTQKIKERSQAPRKLVPIDTGLARALQYGPDNPVGYLYEAAVALDLFRRRSWTEDMEVSYFQDESGREVDFVVSVHSRVAALVQVCFDPTDPDTRNRECRALLAASTKLGCTNLMIVTDSADTEYKFDGVTIQCVPLWKFLLNPSDCPR